jgi:hypothetical protein
MSPTKRPSSVTGLRKGIGTVPAAAVPEDHSRVNDLPPRPEKPIRYTLDLDRERHRYLKEYALQIEANASEVVRELLDELRHDPHLSALIRDRIWQHRR